MPVLRAVLGTIGLGALIGFIVAALWGAPLPAILWLAIVGFIFTFGALFERVYYKKPLERVPGPGWVATEERFVDPTSHRLVQVHMNPVTGERLYVAIGPARGLKAR